MSLIFHLVTFLLQERGLTKYNNTKIRFFDHKHKTLRYEDVEKLVSKPRLNRYLAACGNSKMRAKELYAANLKISQAFYPVLNLFEIILRNKIHDRLSIHFSDVDWITTKKTGFMNDHTLGKKRSGRRRESGFYLKNQVEKAERKLREKRSTITTGKVIAEQSLGFWTTLFEPRHYKLIGGSVIHCFPHKPSTVGRNTISVKLQNIRGFRNRVYHNEPICFNGNNIDFSVAENVKEDIHELLTWIDVSAKLYVEDFDVIDGEITEGKKI